MYRIFREDVLVLQPGIKVLRIVRHGVKSIRSLLEITKAPYRRYVETFNKYCDFVEVKGYWGDSDQLHEYFVNDLFRGDQVFVIEESDKVYYSRGELIVGDSTKIHQERPKPEEIEKDKEYITDKDLEIKL